jgi:hypothetical protein
MTDATSTLTRPEQSKGNASKLALLDKPQADAIARARQYECDPSARVAEFAAAKGEADASSPLRVHRGRREITVCDGGTEMVFRFGRRGRSAHSWGWTCRAHDLVDGSKDTFYCPAAEPYAVLREYGPQFEVWVIELMREALLELKHSPSKDGKRRAKSLLDELWAAFRLDRVGVARFHAPILEAMENGATLADLAYAGGVMNGSVSRPDTSWFMRRVGLRPTRDCHKKTWRVARTMRYENAVKYCRALNLAPLEMEL